MACSAILCVHVETTSGPPRFRAVTFAITRSWRCEVKARFFDLVNKNQPTLNLATIRPLAKGLHRSSPTRPETRTRVPCCTARRTARFKLQAVLNARQTARRRIRLRGQSAGRVSTSKRRHARSMYEPGAGGASRNICNLECHMWTARVASDTRDSTTSAGS